MKRLAALLTALLLGAGSAESWCVAVWYPSSDHAGGSAALEDNLDVIDIVYPFWFTPTGDGRILSQAGSSWQERTARWQEGGALVLPSVFSTLSGFLKEPEVSSHLAELLELAEENGFDGLDIDYEMFPLSTLEPFADFIERLADGLHARGLLLSVTVHAKTHDTDAPESARAQDWRRLAAAADIFNLMTYDWTNRTEPPGPVAPVSWVSEVVGYALSKAEPEKIFVGVPFYGYSWQRGRPPATTTNWEAAERMVSSFDLEPERDADSGELLIDLDVRGLARQTITMSDATTLEARLQALPRDLGGVAVWGLGGEDPLNWHVLREQRPASCDAERFRQ